MSAASEMMSNLTYSTISAARVSHNLKVGTGCVVVGHDLVEICAVYELNVKSFGSGDKRSGFDTICKLSGRLVHSEAKDKGDTELKRLQQNPVAT